MEKKISRKTSEKYDYSTPEAQNLLNEFLQLLSKMARYTEESEPDIQSIEKDILTRYRSRELLKVIVKRFVISFHEKAISSPVNTIKEKLKSNFIKN